MIHSSAVAGHHFLLSRRRGYDPAEVDAVIKRLVTTLRKYEERSAELAQDPDQAFAVTDLEKVRAERDAAHDAASMESQLLEARSTLEESTRVAAARITEAEEEASQIIETARADAAMLLSRRNARAEALITAALSEVKALRARALGETNEYRAGKLTEATALVRTAELQAGQVVEDARHEAGSILGKARREHLTLEKRIGQLRSAIAGIEGQFRHLAESTLEQTDIMSAMIALDAEDLEEVLEDATDTPDVVRLTQQGLTVDLTEDLAAEPAESKHIEERFAVTPGSTIYQRRGGGLRRRLEEDQTDPDET